MIVPRTSPAGQVFVAPAALPPLAVPLLAARCDGTVEALAVCFLLLPQPDVVASTIPSGRASTAVEERRVIIARNFSLVRR